MKSPLRLYKTIMSTFHLNKGVSLLLNTGKTVNYTTLTSTGKGFKLTDAKGKNVLTLPAQLDKVVGIQEPLAFYGDT